MPEQQSQQSIPIDFYELNCKKDPHRRQASGGNYRLLTSAVLALYGMFFVEELVDG